MKSKIQLWKIYSYVGNLIIQQSRTGNITGEFAEELISDFYQGVLANPSTKGYDFIANGAKYQVKARMANAKNKFTGNLSDIHSWNFDYLVVVLFDKQGAVKVVKEFTKQQVQCIAYNSNVRSIISLSSVISNNQCKDLTTLVKTKYGI